MPISINGTGPVSGITSINTSVSDTELGYLDGVTSALQTQINGKGTISTNGSWTTYTPTLTASTTNPTLGTGSTANGAYLQIGKLVIARFYIAFGTSGVSAGSGTYRVSLPVNSNQMVQMSGTVFMFDSTAGTGVANAVAIYDAAPDYVTIIYASAATTYAGVTNAVPWTWAASDQIRGFLIYEAA